MRQISGVLEREPGDELYSSLLSLLRESVHRFLEAHPRVGVMGLARLSGVSHMSIRRILKDETRTIPAPATVLNLLCALSGEWDLRKLAALYPEPIGRYLHQTFPQCRREQSQELTEVQRELLSDRKNFDLFLQCSTSSGVRREELRSLCGADWESRLKSLMRTGLIEEYGSRRLKAATLPLSIDLIRKHLGSRLS